MTNEEAITILEELARCCNYEIVIDSEDVEALNKAIKVLKNERPHGKWIYHEDWYRDGECPWECSECGTCYDYDMNFCGNCGADMREDEV